MPIRGLTHKDDIRPQLPRLGKLRKGGEKTASGFGPELSYFRFVSDNSRILDAFAARFGPKPDSLVVYMPYQTLDENFSTWADVWGRSGLEHRCDGEYMTIWREGSKMVRGQKLCVGGHKDNDYRNDAVGRLEVVIPELLALGFVGTVTMETHGKNDISFIAGVLADVEAKRGSLRGVGFRLYRKQEEISVPGWGERKDQRAKVKKWLVKIEPASEWVLHELGQVRAEALTRGAAPSLPGIETPGVDVETGEIIETQPTQPEATASPKVETTEPASASVSLERPLGAFELRSFLERKALNYSQRDKRASSNQRSLLAMSLEMLFAGDVESEAKRHKLQHWLSCFESIKDMPDWWVLALLDWVKPAKDASGTYWPDGMAVREAATVITQAMEQPAKDELPF